MNAPVTIGRERAVRRETPVPAAELDRLLAGAERA